MAKGLSMKLPWNNDLRIPLWFCRIAVGLLFIFSGLVKANDPLGLAYKLEDYYAVFAKYPVLNLMSGSFFVETATAAAIFMCVLEMALGAALIIGVWPRVTTWITLLLMVFFTFLTGFSHYTGEVTECGCFGTVIPLTPKQSFIKDLILDVPVIFMVLYRRRFTLLFKRVPSMIAAGAATLGSLVFTIMAYNHLPIIDFDFLPFADKPKYEVGRNMCGTKETIYETTLVYRNLATGELKEFTMENYPWQDTATWAWDTTYSRMVQQGDRAPLAINDPYGNDVTDDILQEENYKFLLVAYDLEKTVTKRWDRINKLQSESEKAGWSWYGLSKSGSDVEAFRHEVQIPIEFYTNDDVELKSMIRSNPGLILMEGCVIRGMWHWRDIPSWEQLKTEYRTRLPDGQAGSE
jgi:uncharacterized membrane protein YphA (DoxX/SURF4 family)